MSSDSTGEIFVITKEDGSGVADVRQAGTGSPTGSASTPSSTGRSNAAARQNVGWASYCIGSVAVLVTLLMI